MTILFSFIFFACTVCIIIHIVPFLKNEMTANLFCYVVLEARYQF